LNQDANKRRPPRREQEEEDVFAPFDKLLNEITHGSIQNQFEKVKVFEEKRIKEEEVAEE
jgi:hypothetical protein